MTGYLTNHQVDYVLFHLGHSCELSSGIRGRMGFYRKGQTGDHQIQFRLSSDGLDETKIVYLDGLPILFPGPMASQQSWYDLEDSKLIFHHDLLKSCFYLLTGRQEIEEKRFDSFGRFSFDRSIQKRLGIIHTPLVNYYFEIIILAMERWNERTGMSFRRRKIFKNWAFFLTHDVDSIDTYTLHEAGYRLKQLVGMTPSSETLSQRLRIAGRYLFQSMNIWGRENPHWDFEFLRETERRHGLKSAFYFLPRGRLHHDAYYRFSEGRIRQLFGELDRQGCEIGLHGTVASSTSLESLKRDKKLLERHSPQEVRGIRQHRLLFNRDITHALQEEAGLQYDTTVGFAEHEGFRNSYCLPFRPYDHQKERMMGIWEIPLAMMDVTMFGYRRLNFGEIMETTTRLLNEVTRFHGVFTLLWHNGQGDEFLIPGIRSFYRSLLAMITERRPESLLGNEILRRMHPNEPLSNR